LVQTGQIATGFDGQPGDQGEKILRNYIQGDTIVAYATKHGAIGWGVNCKACVLSFIVPLPQNRVAVGKLKGWVLWVFYC
jgi:hypothetical protein